MEDAVVELQYPIGRFQFEGDVTAAQRRDWIAQIAAAPGQLREAVRGLSAQQLDTPYRPGGWTLRQVVHHLPDSHLNSYSRFRLALTEDNPTIKPYDQSRWAALEDARSAPVEASLRLFQGLHERWVLLLQSMSEADFARTYVHPERGVVHLGREVGLYAWHGRHHVAHITSLRERLGWR
jgi:hypothetical protein